MRSPKTDGQPLRAQRPFVRGVYYQTSILCPLVYDSKYRQRGEATQRSLPSFVRNEEKVYSWRVSVSLKLARRETIFLVCFYRHRAHNRIYTENKLVTSDHNCD